MFVDKVTRIYVLNVIKGSFYKVRNQKNIGSLNKKEMVK